MRHFTSIYLDGLPNKSEVNFFTVEKHFTAQFHYTPCIQTGSKSNHEPHEIACICSRAKPTVHTDERTLGTGVSEKPNY